MKEHPTATAILAADALGLAHSTLAVGFTLPLLVLDVLRIDSISDAHTIMMPIGRFANRHAWLFALSIITIAPTTALFLKRPGARVVPILALGACAQSAVTWCFMFCCSYFLFNMGTVGMHHGPTFDGGAFCAVGFGVFPVSFIAIAAVFSAACTTLIQHRKETNAQQAGPR